MKIKITSTDASWWHGDANGHVTIGEVYEASKLEEESNIFSTFGNDGPAWWIHKDDCEVVEE